MARRKKKTALVKNDDRSGAKKLRNSEDDNSEDKDKDIDEESEESKREDPHAFVLAPDGVSKYIVQKYTDNMKGQDIPQKWVVNSRHGRLYTEAEAMYFFENSTAGCPTYGVCDWCSGSGPTNMHCQVCKDSKRTYKILKTDDHTIIDAKWVSRFFGMMHLVAKADRTHNWMDQQRHAVAMDNVKFFVHERWNGKEKASAFRIRTWELFQEGMTWSNHLQGMRRRGDQDMTILIINQEEMFNG
jgi:hypothetical protein